MEEYQIDIGETPDGKELKKLFSQTTWASQRTLADIIKMLENTNVCVSIHKEDELIGFGRALTDGTYRALLDDIIVDRAHQKKGLGRVIVQQLLEQLAGIEEVFLNTRAEMKEFYQGLGFEMVKTITMKKKSRPNP